MTTNPPTPFLHPSADRIFYGSAIENLCDCFIDPAHETAASNRTEVLDFMRSTWTKKGFMAPEKLISACMNRFYPAIDDDAKNALISHITDKLNHVEPLTGGKRKTFAPLTAALTHLHAIETNTPATVMYADVRNMAITNAHFQQLLTIAQGKPASEDDAKIYTDRATRAAIKIFKQSFDDQKIPVDVVRMGGDEIMFLVRGKTAPQARALMHQHGLTALEDFVFKAGLYNHHHSKASHEAASRGFGVVMGFCNLGANSDPSKIVSSCEAEAELLKAEIGRQRQVRLSPYQAVPHVMQPNDAADVQNAKLRDHLALMGYSPELQNQAIENPLDFADAIAHRNHENSKHLHKIAAAANAHYPHQHLPVDNDTSNPTAHYTLTQEQAQALLAAFETATAPFERNLPQNKAPREALSSLPDAYYFAQPQAREVAIVSLAIKEAGATIDASEERLVHKVLGVIAPIDPATGFYMGDAMPAVFGNFMRGAEAEQKLRISSQTEPTPAFTEAQTPPLYHAMRISLDSLTTANVSGHSRADALLRAFAEDVITPSFSDAGLDPNNIVFAHDGGGHVLAAIPPASVLGINGDMAKILAQVALNIEQKLTPHVADFATIADRRRPAIKGIGVVSHIMPVMPTGTDRPLSGGEIRNTLTAQSEAKIAQVRADKIAAAEAKTSPTPPPAPRRGKNGGLAAV